MSKSEKKTQDPCSDYLKRDELFPMIFILLNCQICIIMVILNVIYHVYIMISNNYSAERFQRRTFLIKWV